ANVPLILPAVSVRVAVAGNSPPGVTSNTSHLPLAPVVDDAAAGAVVVVAVVVDAVEAGAASADARFAVQSPSAKPPKSALPLILSPATLPVRVIGSAMPCVLIVKENFRSLPVRVPPSNGNSPPRPLRTPDTLSPSCLKTTSDVFAPCGELIVTSQLPATVVCADARPGTNNSTESKPILARVIFFS